LAIHEEQELKKIVANSKKNRKLSETRFGVAENACRNPCFVRGCRSAQAGFAALTPLPFLCCFFIAPFFFLLQPRS